MKCVPSCFLVVVACFAAFCDSTLAQQTPFQRWDTNEDGRLTRDELPARLRGNFARVDTNGDGFIDREEDQRFRSARTPKRTSDRMQLVADIPYAANSNARQRLDLLLPARRRDKSPLPVLVFVHGGGWRNGDKRSGFQRLRPFVESGDYVGVSIGYRLSGEAKWPAQLHDCKAAIRWLRANASKHNLDANRIGVWGSSAGGHLVAMLGVTAGRAKLEGRVGEHLDLSSEVACVIDFFGPTDFLLMNKTAVAGATLDHDSPQSPESLLIGGAIQENTELVATANPIRYVSAETPPFLIAHGTNDKLVSFNQSELLSRALQAADVEQALITVNGGGHGWKTRAVDELVGKFLARHLGTGGPKVRNQTVTEVERRPEPRRNSGDSDGTIKDRGGAASKKRQSDR